MKLRINKIFYTLALASCFPLSLNAASFDCSRAYYSIEKLICSSPETSKADSDLNRNYKKALVIAGEALKANQREWLAERNKATTKEELLNIYQKRNEFLTSISSTSDLSSLVKVNKNDSAKQDFLNAYTALTGDVENSISECTLDSCNEILSKINSFKESNLNNFGKSEPGIFTELDTKTNAITKRIESLKQEEQRDNLIKIQKLCKKPLADIVSTENEETILACASSALQENKESYAMDLYSNYMRTGRSTPKFEAAFTKQYNNSLLIALSKLDILIQSDERKADELKVNFPQKRTIFITDKTPDGYIGYINTNNQGKQNCALLKDYPFDVDRKGTYFIWSFITGEQGEYMSQSGDVTQCEILQFSPDKHEYYDMFTHTKSYKDYKTLQEKIVSEKNTYATADAVRFTNNLKDSESAFKKIAELIN